MGNEVTIKANNMEDDTCVVILKSKTTGQLDIRKFADLQEAKAWFEEFA